MLDIKYLRFCSSVGIENWQEILSSKHCMCRVRLMASELEVGLFLNYVSARVCKICFLLLRGGGGAGMHTLFYSNAEVDKAQF